MKVNSNDMDRFFLVHAENRSRQILPSVRISLKNFGEEFEVLAERELIPESLRDYYQQVAEVLAALTTATAEAESQVSEILQMARTKLPAVASQSEPDQDQRVAAFIAGKALEAAESSAWKVLRQVSTNLEKGDWEGGKAHAQARFSLLLDPGPEFNHYWLEDTDFNLLEVPTACLDLWSEDRDSKKAWTFEPGSRMGPLSDLVPHGLWLHGLLSWSPMNWEQLPMVRAIFVDFDLGTGMTAPDAQHHSL